MKINDEFARRIDDGAFDKPIFRGVGRRREKIGGIQQFHDATDPYVARGQLTPQEQRDLLRRLADRIARNFTRDPADPGSR